jgi:hypothetical protein
MSRPRSAWAQNVPGCRPPTPGSRRALMPTFDKAGRPLDKEAALRVMPDTHWAKPYVPVLDYIGSQRGYHVWQLLPEDAAKMDAYLAAKKRSKR